jgi:hypothetical protein
MNEAAWAAIERDEARRLPTPPVATPIQWYEHGDRRYPIAGLVTEIEGPGRLKVVIFRVNALPQHKAGVYHVNSLVHDQANNQTTYRCGSWDYAPGIKPPKEHYDLFVQDIERRREHLRKAEEAAVKAAELHAKREAERFLGTKKPPEPIPA